MYGQKWEYLKYVGCGLAHEMAAGFCKGCVTEKKAKITTNEDNVQYGYALTETNMTTQVTCFPTL